MKRIVVVLLLALSIGATAQENVNLGLIPTPQRVEMQHTSPCHPRKIKEVKVEALPVNVNREQAYQLEIEPKGITLRYVTEEGLRYGRQTLQQLKTIYGDELPRCTITDWPVYKWRGWMDDISRGPVPHAKYREKQWNTLHALKYNFCNYYTEHTLYQSEFPDLAPAYAAECTPHPDEVINLQLFAHAEKTLRVPFYQNMMDSKVNFNPSVEETYGFLKKRIAAAYRRIPNSPFFIINCDETEQLGTGRAKRLVDSLGADKVYVDFINRCYDLVLGTRTSSSAKDSKADGDVRAPRVAMWGDIVAKNPAMMRQLPKDMIYIMWAYEPIDSFTGLIKPFKEHGNPFWVAASTGHSATMTSTPQRYIKNIANLFRDGYRDGAEGAMLTCWDDNGEALFDNSWHAHYWAAEMAWNPLKTDDPEELRQREAQFNENFERLFYGGKDLKDTKGFKDLKVADLYAVGALMYNPIVGDWYTSAALMEPLLNFNPDNTAPHMGERIEEVRHLIDGIHVDSAANPHAHYALQRVALTADKCHLRMAINSALENPDMYSDCKAYADDYLNALFDLKREYLRLWDQENGDYERYIVMNRYDDLAREVLELDRHVFISLTPSPSPSGEGSRYPMVSLRTLFSPLSPGRGDGGEAPIYYTLDGSTPNEGSTRYEKPFPLDRSATVKAITYNEYGEGVVTEQYLLSHLGMGAKITLNTKYSDYKPIYSGGGPGALIDGQLGSNATYADGHWQGYWGDSIDAVISLTPGPSPSGEGSRYPKEISMRFMQNTFDWILAPKQIKVYASNDGKEWTLVADKHFPMDPRETGMRLRNYTVDLDNPQLSTPTPKLIRVVVPNPGPLPQWHSAPGQPSYLFTDEIIVR